MGTIIGGYELRVRKNRLDDGGDIPVKHGLGYRGQKVNRDKGEYDADGIAAYTNDRLSRAEANLASVDANDPPGRLVPAS